MNINVQFTDANQTTVASVFGCPQDSGQYPNQAIILDTDPRYIAFISQHSFMNVQGFQNAIKTAVGGIVGANALATAYPLLAPAIEQGVWSDVQALIIDAHMKGALTAAQYAAIQSAVTVNNIPVTLP